MFLQHISCHILPTSDNTLQDDESDGDSDNQPLELVSGTSEKKQGFLKRVAYECIKSGSHNPQITSDPTKRCNTFSS
ncbi:hypothetical protein RIR_jg37077.t1 [Rhizophagus irregularis DAOM 181602=DAOM 197198]|nr:hypothetical protein RIR_jg37077.t1 [Rhizophagus irregularis DAOM 181602=DAOM 197198]